MLLFKIVVYRKSQRTNRGFVEKVTTNHWNFIYFNDRRARFGLDYGNINATCKKQDRSIETKERMIRIYFSPRGTFSSRILAIFLRSPTDRNNCFLFGNTVTTHSRSRSSSLARPTKPAAGTHNSSTEPRNKSTST